MALPSAAAAAGGPLDRVR